MKGKMMFLVSLLVVVFTASAMAEARTITTTWNANLAGYDAVAYNCLDTSRCATIKSQVFNSHISGNTANINYVTSNGPGVYQMDSYYFFKECYVPMEYYYTCTQDCGFTFGFSFTKQANCKAAINSWTVSDTKEIGTPITIDASIKSAFKENNGIPDYKPSSSLAQYYSSDISSVLTVKKGSTVVYTDTESLDLYLDASDSVHYSWTPTQCGSYTITLETDVPDCQCSSTVKDTKTVSFEIACEEEPPCNKEPVLQLIEITPKTPTTSDNLDCDVQVYDYDGNLDHVLFKWHVNGAIVRQQERSVAGIVDYASDQLPKSFLHTGDDVVCEAIVYDEMYLYDSGTDDSYISDGECYPPHVDSVVITPPSPQETDSLACQASVSDVDGDLYDLTFKWYVDNVLRRTQVKSVSGSSDSDTDSLSASFTSYDDEVKCEVTVRDSGLLTDTDYSIVSVAPAPQPENDPPIVSSVDITPSNPEATDELNCDAAFVDTDGNLDHATFKWHVDGVIVRTQTKTVSGSSDSESDTLPNSFINYSDEVVCEVIVYDDEYLYDSGLDSVTVEECVGDPAPVMESVTVTPSSPDTADTLNCEAVVSDVDGDLKNVTFTWKVEGYTVRTQTYLVTGYDDSRIDTLSASFSDAGDHVICIAKVTDKTGSFDEGQDDVVVGSGTCSSCSTNPPSVQSIAMIPTTPSDDQSVTCDATVSDQNGNLEYIDFKWYANGVLKRTVTKSVAGYSDTETDILDDMYTGPGNVIKCDVVVWDSTDLSDHDYQQVTVQSEYQGNPPIIADLPDRWTSVGQGITDIDLWAYTSDTEDPDSNLDFSIDSQTDDGMIDCYISSNRYLRCYDAVEGGYSDVTVRATDTQGLWDNDVMRVWIDEYCSGGSGSCDEEDPVIDNIDITPSDPEDDDQLRCEVEVSDQDGNLDTVTFKWFVEGDLERTKTVTVSDYEDSAYDVLPDDDSSDGDEVKCYAEVMDGDGNTDSTYKKVTIGESSDDSNGDCSIDLYDLDVEDGEISFIIKNQGDSSEDITYRIYIEGDKEYSKTISIGDGSKKTITYNDFDFDDEDLNYEIEVRAEAECGDEDDETVWYSTSGEVTGDCGLDLKNVQYTQNVQSGGNAWVEAQIKNTGSRTYMTMWVYLDSTQTGFTSFWLNAGETVTKRIDFKPSSGLKNMKVQVDSTCGGSDTFYGTMNVGGVTPTPQPGTCNYNGVCEYGESYSNCPYDCQQPAPGPSATSVEIRPNAFDVNIYKSKIITIDISSKVAQEFTLSIEGVPGDWLDYKPSVWVEDQKNTYIFFSPKQGGHYQITVNVRSATEGVTYKKYIDVYVADTEQTQSGDGFTGMLLSGASNIWAIFLMIILLAGVVFYVANRRLRHHHHDARLIALPTRRERYFVEERD